MRKYLSFVKFEHTLFSLPIVIAGAMLASGGIPDGRTILLILCATMGARTAAMAFNRIIDAEIDAANPRTKNREIPSGIISRFEARLVLVSGLAVYFVSAWLICPLVFYLSPFPAVVFALYPYMKRRTSLCHFGVGLVLSFAPAGGWLAVRCSLNDFFIPLMLSIFTFFWVTGFDIIYSVEDKDFDRENGLHSLPALLGAKTALLVSAVSHTVCVVPLIVLQFVEFDGKVFSLTALAVLYAIFLFVQVKSSETELAFFKLNTVAGAFVLVFILCGIYLP